MKKEHFLPFTAGFSDVTVSKFMQRNHEKRQNTPIPFPSNVTENGITRCKEHRQ